MKKTTVALLAFFAATLFAQAASADVPRSCCRPVPRWYLGISGEAVFLNDSDISHDVPGYGNDYDTFHIGYGFNGSIGYRLSPTIRTELELSYRNNEVDETPATIIGNGNSGSRETSYAIMANGYYDWHNSSNYTPYFGAGIGAINLDYPRFYGTAGNYSESMKGWALAYQFMAGVSYRLETGMSPVELFTGYRYFTGENLEKELGPNAPGTTSVGFDSHNVEMGARLYF